MSLTPTYKPVDPVSKVTFSPVSDGKTDALIVTIKTVVPEAQDGSKVRDMEKESTKVPETPKRSGSSDSKRKNRSRTSLSTSTSKSTMSAKSNKASFASQTSFDLEVPSTSVAPHSPTDSPCLKHAAENISRKASHIPSEKVSLCNNCSKSMLSYIFIVQDFLDSLAKEICGNADSKNCVQCLRQETRQSLSSEVDPNTTDSATPAVKRSSKIREKTKNGNKLESSRQEGSQSSTRSTHPKSTHRDVRKYEESAETYIQRAISQQSTKSTSSSPHAGHDTRFGSLEYQRNDGNNQQEGHPHTYPIGDSQQRRHHHGHSEGDSQQGEHQQRHPEGSDQQVVHQGHTGENVNYREHQSQLGRNMQDDSVAQNQPTASNPEPTVSASTSHQPYEQSTIFRKPMERQQPDFTDNFRRDQYQGGESSHQSNFPRLANLSSPFSEEVDGIVSTLSNSEREVYDAARNGAGYDSLAESEGRHISSSSNRIQSEAFVTMCRNNAEALGCLVVGTSLLLSRTSRTLCVVVSEGVSNAFRGPLSAVFHVVQSVRAMDSLGTTKLALLEQPELGISFEKLNVWRLVQFNKCVFLNPDILVTQNCDELFCHEELSAVPDIGWPDCFNSGVFVFVPSIQTFWQLLEFADKQGSYDGGDQGLLNAYFNSWSDDITKKLSFIYNLMANVSYTYTPAFKQFGRNVKVVQFHGSFKPWHVKYFSRTGQISPASAVHPTYVQFVHIWINIFRISALRQLSQEIQSYAHSQEVVCAVELLRFFPLPTESEAEFYLTPPSVRLRLAESKLQRSSKFAEETRRRKSAEFSHAARAEDYPENSHAAQQNKITEDLVKVPQTVSEADAPGTGEARPEITADAEAEGGVPRAEIPGQEAVPDENALPGSEIGNYQGMRAWEQGRMDYQGTASSDNILKRLEFLMAQPK